MTSPGQINKKEFHMRRDNFKTTYILSILIASLSTIASLGGLLLADLYRDNAFVKTTWLGNDAVTLLLAVPLLLGAMIRSNRGSLKARLVWLGMLDYTLYNYAFYLFGSAFNACFLVYVALLGLSIFALIFGLTNLDVNEIGSRFRETTPVKWIGGYFLFVACGLTLVYVTQSILFIATAEVPAIVTQSGHITNVVFALDLTLLIPWFVVGAIWLFKRNPWGYVVAGILSVKGPLYTLILGVNTALVMKAGLGGSGELPLWITLTVLGLLASAALYRNME
jgi:hypothetical protein